MTERSTGASLSMTQILKNIQIVLVRAENPINIGQAARAMRNFGISNLILVDCAKHKVPEAYTPGWKARKILDRARRVKSLDQIIKSGVLAIGFTGRAGKRRGAPRSFSELVPAAIEASRYEKVALVFGNEKNGLSNSELKKCHWIATIPAVSSYSSLNLSHAVAIASFLIFNQTALAHQTFKKPKKFYTTPEEFDALMDDFYKILELVGYQNAPHNNLLERVSEQIRHYFQKTGVERRELHLFKAFLSRMQERLR